MKLWCEPQTQVGRAMEQGGGGTKWSCNFRKSERKKNLRLLGSISDSASVFKPAAISLFFSSLITKGREECRQGIKHFVLFRWKIRCYGQHKPKIDHFTKSTLCHYMLVSSSAGITFTLNSLVQRRKNCIFQ